MRNFMRIGLLCMMTIFLSCSTARMPSTIEYSPPEDFIVTCFSEDADETGDCPDKMNYQDYLAVLITQIDFKNLSVVDDKAKAIEDVRMYIPSLKETDAWQASDRLISQYVTIARLSPYWEYLKQKFGVPKYVSISFFVNETGWGRSGAWRSKKNPGGIGGDGSLRTYPNLLASADAWGHVLTLERYLGRVENFDSPKSWFKAYERGNYWSAPTGYRDRCTVVNKYALEKTENVIILPAFKTNLAQL
jgi:hypothetical protein